MISEANIIYLKNFRTDSYPQNSVDFVAIKDNKVEENFNLNDFSITENSVKASSINYKPSKSIPDKKISLIVAIDISASMDGYKLNFAKNIISSISKKIINDSSEIAIIGFNSKNFIFHNFSDNIADILSHMSKIQPEGITDYNTCFISDYLSCKKIMKSSKFKPVVLVINDGNGISDDNRIIDSLKNIDFRLYSISLNSSTPSIISKLAEIKAGYHFDFIDKLQEVTELNQILPFVIYGYGFQNVSWTSENCDFNRNLVLSLENYGLITLFNYEIKSDNLSFMSISENSYRFGLTAVGNPKLHNFTLKPRIGSFQIKNIISQSPFTLEDLKIGQVVDNETSFNIKYTPIDTNYIVGKITIETNTCQNIEITVSGGSIYSNLANKTIRVISPNGGEIFNDGKTIEIKWYGIPIQDSVSIDFTSNNGKDWSRITKTNGNFFFWTPFNSTFSDSCLVRISQLSSVKKYTNIKELKGNSQKIIKAFWINNDKEIAIASRDGFIRIWDVATTEVIQTIVNDIRYLSDAIISPDDKIFGFITDTSSFIQLYDKQFSKKLYDFNSNNHVLTQIDWNHSGNIITAGTKDGKIIYWEFPNADPIKIIDAFSSQITELVWNNDGSILIAGSAEGDVKSYNLSYNLVSSLKSSDLSINSISWNKSGSVVGITSNLESIRIWDVPTSVNLLNINNDSKPVQKISWDPSLKYILTSTVDSLIKFWLPASGDLYYNFDLHNGIVSEIEWSNDGSLICSGSENGEVFIWNPKDIPFESAPRQLDISDSVFSISKPKYEIKGVIFGECKINKGLQINVEPFFKNTGKSKIKIDSIKLFGDTKDYFQIVSNQNNVLLNQSDSINLSFSFQADKPNYYFDTILIYTDFGLVKTGISANVILEKINIQYDILDLGEVLLDDSSSIKINNLTNLSPNNIKIDKVEIIDNEFNDLKLLTNASGDIPNNGNFPLEFKCYGIKYGYRSWRIKTTFDNSQDSMIFVCYAKIIAPKLILPSLIDLGIIPCDASSIENLFIKNVGDGLLTINQIKNANPKIQIKPNTKQILPGDSTNLIVSFNNLGLGLFADSITIETNKQTNYEVNSKSKIMMSKDTSYLKFSDSSVIFLNIEPNLPYTKELYVINNGSKPITLKYPIEYQYFTILDIQPDFVNTGEEAIITIKFKGSPDNGIYKQNHIYYDLCNHPYSIEFYAYLGTSDAIISSVPKIEFDKVLCTDSINIKELVISNTGSSPLLVNRIELTNNQDFSIGNNIDNLIIKPGNSSKVRLIFKPTNLGLRTSKLKIYSNAKNGIDGINSMDIEGNFDKYKFKFSSDTCKFDVYENTSLIKEVYLKNTGTLDYKLTTPFKIGKFEIVSADPEMIRSGDSSKLSIKFIGGDKDSTYNSVFSIVDSCSAYYNLNLMAHVKPFPSVGIKIDSARGRAGEVLKIPIRIYSINNKELPTVDYYKFSIAFESTILVPIDKSLTTEIQNNIRIIKDITLSSKFSKDSIIGYLEVMVTLGDTSSSELIIFNTEAVNNSSITIETKSGYFIQDGICIAGGERLIEYTGQLRLLQNNPNPAVDITTINIETIENGESSFKVYDIYGNEIINYPINSLPGKYSIKLDCKYFSQGTYFYVLQTPNQSRIRKMIIAK